MGYRKADMNNTAHPERITATYPLQVTVGAFGINLSLAAVTGFDLVELNDTIQARDTDKAAERFAFDATHSDPWLDSGEAARAYGRRHAVALSRRGAAFDVLAPGGWAADSDSRRAVSFRQADRVLAAGGSATVEVWKVASGSPADSTYALTAYDWLLPSGGSLSSGTPVLLLQHLQSKRFYVVGAQHQQQTLIGKSDPGTPSINKGTYVIVHVYSGAPGAETDSGTSVSAWNPFGDIGASKWVACALINGYWYLIAAEC